MSDDTNKITTHAYGFDPSYGYTLERLLAINAPKEPKGFDEFWEQRYQSALETAPKPYIRLANEQHSDWWVFSVRYTSTDQLLLRGWLLLPKKGVITRGFVIGHGYGGRDQPDFHLPFKDAALFFPCFRGLGLSTQPGISSDPFWHVRHDIDKCDRYILGGCVQDVWLAVSAILTLFPELQGHLGYLGISFSGGIGALALAWEKRIARGHLNVPTFGHHPLRLKLPSQGSANSVQLYYKNHKKATLKVLRYYDSALAARRITMPMHCALALYDPCVAPPGQFAIYNAMTAQKKLFVLDAGHHTYPKQAEQEQSLLAELDEFFAPLKD